MNPLYLVIRSVKRSIWNLFVLPKEVKDFGWRFAVKDISLKICFNWTQSPQLFEKKHKNIFRWLEQNYPEELTKIENGLLFVWQALEGLGFLFYNKDTVDTVKLIQIPRVKILGGTIQWL